MSSHEIRCWQWLEESAADTGPSMKEIHVHVFRVLEMDELSDDAVKKIVGLDNTNI